MSIRTLDSVYPTPKRPPRSVQLMTDWNFMPTGIAVTWRDERPIIPREMFDVVCQITDDSMFIEK